MKRLAGPSICLAPSIALVMSALVLGPAETAAQHMRDYYARPEPVVVIPRDAPRPYAVLGRAGPYNWCEAKSGRLAEFEHRVRIDGRVSQDEARIANALRADLASICAPRSIRRVKLHRRIELPPK